MIPDEVDHIASLIDPDWPDLDEDGARIVLAMAQRVYDAGYRMPSALSSQQRHTAQGE